MVSSLYRSPKKLKNLCQTLQNICLANPDIPVWAAGDINLPNVEWESLCFVNDTYPADIYKTIYRIYTNGTISNKRRKHLRYISNKQTLSEPLLVVLLLESAAILAQSPIIATLKPSQRSIHLCIA